MQSHVLTYCEITKTVKHVMAGSCVPLSNGPLWERIQQLQLYLLVLSVRSHAGSFETITHALDLNSLVENHGHVNVKPTLLTIQQLLK